MTKVNENVSTARREAFNEAIDKAAHECGGFFRDDDPLPMRDTEYRCGYTDGWRAAIAKSRERIEALRQEDK